MLLKDATDVRVGTTPVQGVYVGTTKIWPSAFSPTSLSGLKVWLDAVDYTGSAWPNKVAGGATPVIVGTPAMVVSPVTLNGKQVVRFATNEGRLRGNAIGVTQNYTLLYVVRLWGINAGRAFSADFISTGANFLVGFHSSAQDCMYDNGWLNAGIVWSPPMTGWKLYGADANTAMPRSRFFINGVLSGTGSNGAGMANTFNLSGFSNTGAEETMDCEVAEMLIYDRELSDAERAQAEGYLRTKWGLS